MAEDEVTFGTTGWTSGVRERVGEGVVDRFGRPGERGTLGVGAKIPGEGGTNAEIGGGSYIPVPSAITGLSTVPGTNGAIVASGGSSITTSPITVGIACTTSGTGIVIGEDTLTGEEGTTGAACCLLLPFPLPFELLRLVPVATGITGGGVGGLATTGGGGMNGTGGGGGVAAVLGTNAGGGGGWGASGGCLRPIVESSESELTVFNGAGILMGLLWGVLWGII